MRRGQCWQWPPLLAPLLEGVSGESGLAKGKVGERLFSALLCICTALSAPSLVFITSGSFVPASVLPWVTLTTFFSQFTSLLPCFLQNHGGTALFRGRGPFQRCFFCVCFGLTSLHSSEDILHSSHAGCFNPDPLPSPAPPPLFCTGLLGLLLVCSEDVPK